MEDYCPNCGSKDILRKKFSFGNVTIHDRFCNKCHLFEDYNSSEKGFDIWVEKWSNSKLQSKTKVRLKQSKELNIKKDFIKDDFIDRICSDVTNDALRLDYAQSINNTYPEHAQFIRLQVERFHAEILSNATQSLPSIFENELFYKNRMEWGRDIKQFARPYKQNVSYLDWNFERGFIAEIRTDPDLILDPNCKLFEIAPIEHLDLTNCGSIIHSLTSERLAQVRSFGLNNLLLNDDDMIVLVSDARLDSCEYLDLRSNNITWKGIKTLCGSKKIRNIPIVLLTFNPCNPAVQFYNDLQGGFDRWLPTEGIELEKEFGPIPWLNLPNEIACADRYHARNVNYIEIEK